MLTAVHQLVWGPAGVGLLAAAGLWLTVQTGWFQLTHLRLWLSKTLGAILTGSPDLGREGEGSISPWQSLCTALGATIGTGSIVGVGAALISGGPGSIFWMWVMALFGMMTSYAENLLGLRYRQQRDGIWQGGPMYYLTAGLGARPGCRTLGRVLAGLFALLCILASFGIGNLSQANAIAASLETVFHLPPLLTGGVLAAATGLILWRGIRGVAAAAEKLVPLMAVFYLLGTLAVVVTHASALPAALGSIWKGAFGWQAAGGGVVGYGMAAAIQWGFMRGSFSSEAGLGSSAIASGSASTREPVQQGMWGIFQVFVSTFLVCTMTALAMLTSGLVDLHTGQMLTLSPAPDLAGEAFSTTFGSLGPVLIAGAVLLFAWSSMLGWSQYGAICWEYLLGPSSVFAYRLAFLALIVAGANVEFSSAWALSDTFNGLMMLPNLAGLVGLSGEVAAETRAYLHRTKPSFPTKSPALRQSKHSAGRK